MTIQTFLIMYRKYLATIIISFLIVNTTFSRDNDSTFVIKGFLAGEKEGKIFLRYNKTTDSTEIKNGHFNFSGIIPQPALATLWMEASDGRQNAISFYIDATDVEVSSIRSLKSAIVQAGQTEAENQVYNKLQEPLNQKRSQLYVRKETHRSNKDSLRILTRLMADVQKESVQLQVDFVKKFPDSYISLDLVKSNSYGIVPEVLEEMLGALGQRFKSLPEIKDIEQRLEIAQNTWIGKPAPNFTQNDVNGNAISLESFRGKYVLVDFWASWCGWCRIEHPFLIDAYNKYKDKGFTILSVSIDDAKDREKWIEAFKKDGLIWPQVSDLKGRDNSAARLYGIKAIPQNFIIDPNGIIVAKNLRGDDLTLKLEELLEK